MGFINPVLRLSVQSRFYEDTHLLTQDLLQVCRVQNVVDATLSTEYCYCNFIHLETIVHRAFITSFRMTKLTQFVEYR